MLRTIRGNRSSEFMAFVETSSVMSDKQDCGTIDRGDLGPRRGIGGMVWCRKSYLASAIRPIPPRNNGGMILVGVGLFPKDILP